MSTTHSPQNRSAPMPPLHAGDRLTADEFLRRYEAMPNVNKAELVEGKVSITESTSAKYHAEPLFDLVGFLGSYLSESFGIRGGTNTTILHDPTNVPQPDAHLRIESTHGGQCQINDKGYIVGGPELVAEVAASSASHDLHDKFQAYQRNHIREYIVWRVWDKAVDWFVLHEDAYIKNESNDGILKSRVFPGLWLDAEALVGHDMSKVLDVLRQGMTSPDYAGFVSEHKGKAE